MKDVAVAAALFGLSWLGLWGLFRLLAPNREHEDKHQRVVHGGQSSNYRWDPEKTV